MIFLTFPRGALAILAVSGVLAGFHAEAASDAMVVASARKSQSLRELRSIPEGGTICVNPVQNLGESRVDMTGIDEELVAQVAKTGYRAGKLGELETCDATAYTEIVHIGGRKRVNADVEFRIVLAGEQIPRLVSTVNGKKSAAAREAIVEAFAQQARKIQAAQREGMAPYATPLDQQD